MAGFIRGILGAVAAVLVSHDSAAARTDARRESPGLRRLPWRERQAGRQDHSDHLGTADGLPLYPAPRFQARRPQERDHAADRFGLRTRRHAGDRRIFLEEAVARSRPAARAEGCRAAGADRQPLDRLHRLSSRPVSGRQHRAAPRRPGPRLSRQDHGRLPHPRPRQQSRHERPDDRDPGRRPAALAEYLAGL